MKKLFLILLLLLSLLTLVSCIEDDGSDGDVNLANGPAVEASSASLFSRWQRRTDHSILDLTRARFHSLFNFVLEHPDGGRCNCTLTISGSENSGTFTLSGCRYQFGGGADPGCSGQNGITRYKRDGNFLNWVCSTFGNPLSCGTYNAD